MSFSVWSLPKPSCLLAAAYRRLLWARAWVRSIFCIPGEGWVRLTARLRRGFHARWRWPTGGELPFRGENSMLTVLRPRLLELRDPRVELAGGLLHLRSALAFAVELLPEIGRAAGKGRGGHGEAD